MTREQAERDQMEQFLETHVRTGGKGVYLRDLYTVYQVWVAKAQPEVGELFGKIELGWEMEKRRFIRGDRWSPFYEKISLVGHELKLKVVKFSRGRGSKPRQEGLS